MDSDIPKVALDLSPMVKIYEDGRIERFMGTETVPPSLDDPKSHVRSKDVVYSPEANLSSRLYLPKNIDSSSNQKLPLLIYYHGGAFVLDTPFSPFYHNYLNTLVAEANIVAVSVDYRKATEHLLPTAYEDSWTALKWVASHFNGDGPEEWLNLHADFDKVFVAGVSSGGNITHQVAVRYGKEKLSVPGVNLAGIVLIHPYFWGEETLGDEAKNLEWKHKIEALWRIAYPTLSGLDDPLINPVSDPNFGKLGCKRVLVIVAGKDIMKDRGWHYYDSLKKSGWDGVVEMMEEKEEPHVFHLFNPTCEKAIIMLKKISSFFNQAN